MIRLLLSLILGIGLGIGIGLIIGWGVFPAETVGNPIEALAPAHQDDYTAMVAAGFRADGDTIGAVERIERLGVIDVPAYVRETTIRFIETSRSVDDIYHMVAFSQALGQLTPEMEPFLQVQQAP
jgi:hypothetical protein